MVCFISFKKSWGSKKHAFFFISIFFDQTLHAKAQM